DLPGPHQLLERAHRFGDRRLARPVKQVHVEVVDAQPPEAGVASGERAAMGRVAGQDLAHDEELFAPAPLVLLVLDEVAEHLLAAAVAVEVGGVDVGEAEVETERERVALDLAVARRAHLPGSLADDRHELLHPPEAAAHEGIVLSSCMHVESKEFVIRFELRAAFPDDYEGDDDGYAWTPAFQPVAQALVTAVAGTVAAHPGWKFPPGNRGRSSEDEVTFVLERTT